VEGTRLPPNPCRPATSPTKLQSGVKSKVAYCYLKPAKKGKGELPLPLEKEMVDVIIF